MCSTLGELSDNSNMDWIFDMCRSRQEGEGTLMEGTRLFLFQEFVYVGRKNECSIQLGSVLFLEPMNNYLTIFEQGPY